MLTQTLQQRHELMDAPVQLDTNLTVRPVTKTGTVKDTVAHSD